MDLSNLLSLFTNNNSWVRQAILHNIPRIPEIKHHNRRHPLQTNDQTFKFHNAPHINKLYRILKCTEVYIESIEFVENYF